MPQSSSFWDHPIATIEKALNLRKQIESLQASLHAIYGNGKEPSVSKAQASEAPAKDGRKGKRSAATRAKMAAAQKARWAAKNKGTVTLSAEPAAKSPKKKRTMSPEARARIAAAQRARWAKVKR